MRKFVCHNLDSAGFRTSTAADGADALKLLSEQPFDLLLLDIGLPGPDGLAVLSALRRHSRIPVMIISARGREADRVQAFDLGANDYLTKPFGVAELVARVRALLRRTAPDIPKRSGNYHYGSLEIDFWASRARIDGRDVPLTPREFEVLAYLASNAGRVVPHRQILIDVWGNEYGEEFDYVRAFVQRIREKIEPDLKVPEYVLTEPSGYYMPAGVADEQPTPVQTERDTRNTSVVDGAGYKSFAAGRGNSDLGGLAAAVIGQVAHDLKNELAIVGGTLRSMTPPEDEVEMENFEAAQRALAQSDWLVKRLILSLDVPPPKGNVVDLEQVVSTACRLFRPRLRDDVKLEIAIADPKPRLVVEADPDHLFGVCTELLRNASRAIGKRSGVIRVSLGGDAKTVLMRMEDDGPGFPAGVLQRVLDRDVSMRVGQGAGLVLTRRLVEAYGGSLEPGVSKLGGACIIVRLPSAPTTPVEPRLAFSWLMTTATP